jgi:hypothetical protein
MVLPPSDVFREQLASLFYGCALWVPDPAPLYQQVSIGDVGYVRDGYFVRMFNVLLEWDDPRNRTFCLPEEYTRLDMGPFVNVRKSKFSKGPYYSRQVTTEEVTYVGAVLEDEYVVIALSQITTVYIYALSSSEASTVFSCKRQGAVLVLPYDGRDEDVIRTKGFEDYIRDNVDSWFSFARRNNLGVERMEDLILVTGCTLVSSWGVAAFIDNAMDAEFSLKSRHLAGGGAMFDWRIIRPSVVHRDSHQEPVRSPRRFATSVR